MEVDDRGLDSADTMEALTPKAFRKPAIGIEVE
jgi:hypothetical protein